MKNLFLIVTIILYYHTVSAQYPTVKAVGGEGKNVNWQQIKTERLKDEYFQSEGWFSSDCEQGVVPIKASSTLAAQGAKNYLISNLNNDPLTAWVEGVEGYGIGEWFEVKATNVNTIYNGYQSSPTNWANNSRVKKFKVYKNGKPICFLELTDEMGKQTFELPGSQNETEWIFRFEIVDIYQGLKWDDVAISYVGNMGCCFAANTQILLENSLKPISTIDYGNTIKSYNMLNKLTSNVEVVKTAKQTHLSLIQIKTNENEISLTSSHPLYFKNYGFCSIDQLLFKTNLQSLSQLENNIEILTWNSQTQKSEYKTIKNISKIEGVFETYSIIKISNGETYIANGFITKTY